MGIWHDQCEGVMMVVFPADDNQSIHLAIDMDARKLQKRGLPQF